MARNNFSAEQHDPRVKFLDMGNCQRIGLELDDLRRIDRDLNEDAVFHDNNRRLLSSFSSMPPDFLEKGEKTLNYDAWAFGVFAYNLLFDEMPFAVNQIHDVAFLRKTFGTDSNFNKKVNSLDIGLGLIVRHLLSPNGEDRPSTDAIVRLLSWLIYEPERFQDKEFIIEVIAQGGFDPEFEFVRDYY